VVTSVILKVKRLCDVVVEPKKERRKFENEGKVRKGKHGNAYAQKSSTEANSATFFRS
jgi:hypothetical protein